MKKRVSKIFMVRFLTNYLMINKNYIREVEGTFNTIGRNELHIYFENKIKEIRWAI